MPDISGPTGGNPEDASSHDPTTIIPATPAPHLPPVTHVPHEPQAPAAMAAASMPADEYSVSDRQLSRKPGTMIAIAFGAILLLGAAAFFFFANDDTDTIVTTEVNDSVQLDISRITRTEEAVAATMTATVTGPADRPAEYRWILPAGAEAPQPATGATDASGQLKFAWAPITAPADDTAWSSTVTIDEVLPPNATLADTSFECVLDRNDATSTIILAADVSPEPVTEQRTVIYSFANTEFVPGDSITCPILSGDENIDATTTTLIPETSTTLPPETSTIPTSTIAPTTLPDTTIAPVVTTPAATATTAALKTTVISVIASRTDLSTFLNLIDRAGLRDQLSAQNAMFTVVAPNNAAIEALLATSTPPDLNNPAAAREFVLAHVKTGEVLTRANLAALPAITFDFGPERVIDATVSPITIGGAGVIEADAVADLGVVHTLGRTLVTPAP